ncbi:MAG: chromosomal replication initiator protein DnaA [Eubacterium sp.]|nr:chromosomal replication initiator protein DnaA [Eubacterium sp.]
MCSFNSFADIFEEVKKLLTLSPTAMRLWIDPLKPLKLNNNQVLLYIGSDFARDMTMNNFGNMLTDAFSELLGFEIELKILCDKDLTHEQRMHYGLEGTANGELEKELEDDYAVKTRLDKSEKESNYKHTFDTFIVGDNNRLAYAACKAVVQEPSTKYNPLFIYSEPGLGKTHLLSAVKTEMERLHPEMNIIYTNGDTFTDDFVSSIRANKTEEFKAKYRNCDMLLIDDVQFISNKVETQQELFHTFNYLHTQSKQIIFTSDRPPKEINGIEERLLGRFEWGLLADIAPPEYETRIAIIKRKAELFKLNLPDNVIEFLADKLKTNIRQLEGAITKINALVVVTGVTPTLNMAQSVVKDILSSHEPIPVTVEKIINEVAKIYSVDPDDIRSAKRSSQISIARQVAIYVVSRITGLSYSSIGEEFGHRDHSTIVYAITKVKTNLEKDSSFKSMVDDMIKNLGNTTV